jgi:TrpR-related protein YerC/YecD
MHELYEAILKLNSVEECEAFFDDLCTPQEVQNMLQRLQVAKMITAGHTYVDIEAKTGASTATIARVKRSLEYGSGGYKHVL